MHEAGREFDQWTDNGLVVRGTGVLHVEKKGQAMDGLQKQAVRLGKRDAANIWQRHNGCVYSGIQPKVAGMDGTQQWLVASRH